MTGKRGSGPSPDGRHDDLLPEDLDGLTLHAPDDARELAADWSLWLTEEAAALGASQAADSWAARRAARRRRLTLTAAVLVAALLMIAVSAAVGAWVVGPQASRPPAAPLASSAPPPGQIGGLLPEDALLQDGSTALAARTLRPSVIALVPPQCDECPTLLTRLASQVGSFGVTMAVVGRPDQADQLASLASGVGPSRVSALTDVDGTLGATYGVIGTTLLLVREDGVVVDVVHDPTAGTHLEGSLVELVSGAASHT